MSFRNIRPLHILWQEGTDVRMRYGVCCGIIRVLCLAGVFSKFRIEHLAQRRQPNWRLKNGMLLTYQSLDWHIEWARFLSNNPGHLNSKVLLDSLKDSPTYQTGEKYELVVVNEPLHFTTSCIRTISGVARQGQGAIISVNPHLHLLQPLRGESDADKNKRQLNFGLSTQMLTMHELGHVFGLFKGTGTENPTDEELKKSHCLNECVMQFRESTERDKKITDNPFCQSCLIKLKQFFIKQ